MKRIFVGFVVFTMVLFIVAVTMLFLNERGLLGLPENVIGYFKTFQTIITSIIAISALGMWVVGFYIDGITKYCLHEISGIIGSALFLVAFVGILLGFSLIYLLMLGGFLCLYCMLVPPITSLSKKFSNSKWEPALLWAVIASLTVFGLSTLSNIFINEVFGVDAKYFTQTKPIAMLIAATPVTAILSFICLLASLLPLYSKNGKFSFHSANSFIASYALMVSSLAFGGNIDDSLQKTAANVDFNSNHPCNLDGTVAGVIFLDPSLKNVLVYRPDAEKKYSVELCNMHSSD